MNTKKKPVNVRYMTMTAMLSAIAFVLMMLEFSIPIMPSFIKLDFSELPALMILCNGTVERNRHLPDQEPLASSDEFHRRSRKIVQLHLRSNVCHSGGTFL